MVVFEESDFFEERAVFVSPLAKLSFKLFVVGDTGLKTGWVR